MFSRDKRYSFKHGLPEDTVATPLFSLRYGKSEKGTFAVVVSKKIDKRATVRNRLRRMFREALKDILKNHEMPFDLVFFLRRGVTQTNQSAIQEELQRVMHKLK